jgi:hypothetical protein
MYHLLAHIFMLILGAMLGLAPYILARLVQLLDLPVLPWLSVEPVNI